MNKYIQYSIILLSEGGTGEDWKIEPHLNFGNFIEKNNNIWKKLAQILTKIENFFRSHLDKIRSALTEFTHSSIYGISFHIKYVRECRMDAGAFLKPFHSRLK